MRRQQATETRERIVAAGSDLVHEFPTWSWRDLSVRAVAQRAGVNERTVYRHFSTERELRDTVMRRLEDEAGVALTDLDLDHLPEITARIFGFMSSLAVAPKVPSNPTFTEADQRKRDALLDTVERAAADWSSEDRELAAAVFDVLWSVPSYERLVTAWRLEPEEATRAMTWVIDLVSDAIRDGRAPGSDTPATRG